MSQRRSLLQQSFALIKEQATAEYYEKEDAQKCLNSAESILNNAKKFSKI
jgi:HEPN domain-containing protein